MVIGRPMDHGINIIIKLILYKYYNINIFILFLLLIVLSVINVIATMYAVTCNLF